MTTIALLGDRDPAFETHRALDATVAAHPEIRWVATDSEEARSLESFDGIWIAPGSPYRDDARVYDAIAWARTTGRPLLGTCAGFQYSVVEFARNVAGLDAGHAEDLGGAPDVVVDRLACGLYGERRTVRPVAGTRFASLVGTDPFEGFHFCGFGVRREYLPALEQAGLVVAAWGDDAGAEAVELPGHPFFFATLFQVQMIDPHHPLILAFLASTRE